MRTGEAQRQLTLIANVWRPIPHWSINPVVNTALAISSFAAQTCLACAAAKRFDNSGKRQLNPITKKMSGRGSSTFVRSVRVLISQITDHESRYLDQTTRILGLYVLPREGPFMAARSYTDRILGV